MAMLSTIHSKEKPNEIAGLKVRCQCAQRSVPLLCFLKCRALLARQFLVKVAIYNRRRKKFRMFVCLFVCGQPGNPHRWSCGAQTWPQYVVGPGEQEIFARNICTQSPNRKSAGSRAEIWLTRALMRLRACKRCQSTRNDERNPTMCIVNPLVPYSGPETAGEVRPLTYTNPIRFRDCKGGLS